MPLHSSLFQSTMYSYDSEDAPCSIQSASALKAVNATNGTYAYWTGKCSITGASHDLSYFASIRKHGSQLAFQYCEWDCTCIESLDSQSHLTVRSRIIAVALSTMFKFEVFTNQFLRKWWKTSLMSKKIRLGFEAKLTFFSPGPPKQDLGMFCLNICYGWECILQHTKMRIVKVQGRIFSSGVSAVVGTTLRRDR